MLAWHGIGASHLIQLQQGFSHAASPAFGCQAEAASRRRQLAWCDWPRSLAAGRVLAQSAIANGQRSKKGQPALRSANTRALPWMVIKRAPRVAPKRGRAPNRPRVYGCAMWAKTICVGPLST